MKISELIAYLEKAKDEHGDIPVVYGESHEYWGTVHSHMPDYNLSVGGAQPEGPKSSNSCKAVIIEKGF